MLRALPFAEVRGDLPPGERGRMNPGVVWNIEKGQALTASEVIRARRDRSALSHRAARFFDVRDLLVCPTAAVQPFPAERRFPAGIAGERPTTQIDRMFLTSAVTLTGCPAISRPAA